MKKLLTVSMFIMITICGCGRDENIHDNIKQFLYNEASISNITEALVKHELLEEDYKLYQKGKIKGKVFCSYGVTGYGKETQDSIEAFLQASCSNYMAVNNEIEYAEGEITAGWALPLSVVMQKEPLKILEHKIPRDLKYLKEDLKTIFPGEYYRYVDEKPKDATIKSIDQAKKYYGIE